MNSRYFKLLNRHQQLQSKCKLKNEEYGLYFSSEAYCLYSVEVTNKDCLMVKIFLIILFSFASLTSHAANLINRNANGEFYAHLNSVKLLELTTFIKNSYGIDFKGPDILFQTPISVSFESLTLEEMLKRILSGNNYVFSYNSKGNITEVTLLPTNRNEMKPRGPSSVMSEKPQMPTDPSLNVSQGNIPVPDGILGSQEVKIDRNNKQEIPPIDPSLPQAVPNVPLPVE
jgi:hypothetical protein